MNKSAEEIFMALMKEYIAKEMEMPSKELVALMENIWNMAIAQAAEMVDEINQELADKIHEELSLK